MTRLPERPRALLVAAAEGTLGILGHPGRSALIALGAIIGTALFTATLGLVGTARSEVRADFDAFRATEVVASFESPDPTWVSEQEVSRLGRLNGVVSAGLIRTSDERFPMATVIERRSLVMARVSGVTPSALEVIEPHIARGRMYDQIHEDRAIPVAVVPDAILGELAGARLGSQILVDGEPVVVIGVYDGVARGLDTLGSVLVPLSVSEAWLPDEPAEVMVEVAPGAAKTIASQLPLALRPDRPESVRATSLLDPEEFRLRIEGSVVQLSLAISIAALVIGAAVIGVAAGSSVATRTQEFGLRRALGATPVDMGLQVLGETMLLGVFGGAVGASLGLLATVAVSLANGWTPAIDVASAFWSAAFAAAGGLLGGIVPARRAMRIEPAVALRR